MAIWLLLAWAGAPHAYAQTDFWRPVDGPYGGVSVTDIVKHDDAVVAATSSGAFRSEDGGLTWASASSGFAQPDVRDLHVSDDGTLYAATFGDGLYRWDSGAGAWIRQSLPATFLTAITQTHSGRFVVATNAGVRISDDAEQWQTVSLDGIQAVPAVLSASDTHVFVGTSVGVFRSADDGLTWTYASFGMLEFDVRSLAVNADGHVFAGTTPKNNQCAVYRSRGSGNLWTCIQPISDPVVARALAVGSDGRLMLGGYRTVQSSTDEGSTWRTRTAAPTTIQALAEIEPGVWLAGSAGAGLVRSEDEGFSWAVSNDGLFSPVRDVLLHDGRVYAATSGGIFVTSDHGASWDRVRPETPLIQDVRKLAVSAEGHLLAGTAAGLWRLALTDAHGGTVDDSEWELLGPQGRPRIGALAIGPEGAIYVGFHSGVQIFGGSSWTPMYIQGDDGAYRDVTSLAVLDDGSVIAGAAWDSWRLEPGSTTWSLMSTSTLAWFDFQSIAARDGRILIGTRFSGVLESTDGGRNWRTAAPGLNGQEDVQTIAFDRFGNPFIGTFGSGVYQLHPFTRQWTPANTGLGGHLRIRAIAFDDTGIGWVGTMDGGLYAHGITSVHVEEDDAPPTAPLTPRTPALAVYPNPTAGRATVTWDAPLPSPERLQVFDLLGRQVADVAVSAGDLTAELSTDTWPRGVYVVRMSGQTVLLTRL
ncbi:MAG: T9SS type A sorting domain-containing protein [Rhodothermales bacterium]